MFSYETSAKRGLIRKKSKRTQRLSQSGWPACRGSDERYVEAVGLRVEGVMNGMWKRL